jgi:predicted transcriptional regulator
VLRRSYFEIIAEMLETARGGAKKTVIMRRCNLASLQTNKILPHLLETGLLKKGNSYFTTETGLHFLKAYHNLELLLKNGN